MRTSRPIRTSGHDDGVDRWSVTRAAPAATLAGRIDGYAAYREETRSFAARRELAGTSGVLIYVLGDPLEIVGADGAAVVIRAGDAFIGGAADATSLSRALGPQDGVHLFMPLASLAAVAGAPVSEVTNRVALLSDLIGQAALDLGHALGEAQDEEQRFDLIDAFLMRRFAEARPADPLMEEAARRLAAAEGPSSTDLADALGWSRKRFARAFRDEIGFAPDRYRRLARFERFADALAEAPADSLAGLAAEHGYVDQPHLARDVREFSGMTPGELRQRLIPGGGGGFSD